MPSRPFERYTIDEMEAVFRRASALPSTLAALAHELSFRNSNRAKALLVQVEQASRQAGIALMEEVGMGEDSDRSLDPQSPQAKAARVKIAELRQRLLDLSNRNRLINFKHSARGGRQVRIVGECLPKLITVVGGEKPVELIPLPPLPSEPEDERKPEFVASLEEAMLTDKAYLKAVEKLEDEADEKAEFAMAKAERALRDRVRKKLGWTSRSELFDVTAAEQAKQLGIDPSYELTNPQPRRGRRKISQWQTLVTEDELDRRLRALDHQMRESREEYGVETLYLIVGFLEWLEKTPGGTAEAPNLSPLLLVPISIERRAPGKKPRTIDGKLLLEDGEEESRRNRDSYTFQAGADEISVNLCLRERLRLDFGIELPEWDEELGVEAFIGQVQQAIADQFGWKVRSCATISHLAFNRLAMWVDLDPEKPGVKPPYLHPVLGELFGGGQKSDRNGDLAPEEDEEAGVPSLIMDCDSSQFAAIKAALGGRNLTIQGPPGTGKSQTIANLIASCLQEGKTVLFVAEKMAALDVVQSRLNEAGIGDFLLELHSAKAGKKPVLDSIKRRLNRRRQRNPEVAASLTKRRLLLRNKLNAYASAVNASFGTTGMTVHDILWRCYEYREKPLPERLAGVRLAEVAMWDRDAVDLRREALETCAELEDRHRREQVDGEHPWSWVQNPRLHVQECDRLVRHVLDLRARLAEIDQWLDRVRLANLPTSFAAINVLAGELKALGPRPEEISSGLWGLASQPGAERTIEMVIAAWQRAQQAEDALREIAPASLRERNEAERRVTRLAELAERMVPQAAGCTDGAKLGAQKAGNAELLAQLQGAISMMERLATVLPLGVPVGYQELHAMATYLAMASSSPREIRSRRHALGQDSGTDLVRAKLETMEAIASESVALSARAKVPIETLEVSAIEKHRTELLKGGLFAILRASYRAARRFCAETCPEVPNAERIEFLGRLAAYLRRRHEIENDADLKTAADELFLGWQTDRPALLRCCDWVEEVRKQTPIIERHGVAIRKHLYVLTQDQAELAEQLSKLWILTFRTLAMQCERQGVLLSDLESSLKEEQKLIEDTQAAMAALEWQGPLEHARVRRVFEALRSQSDAYGTLTAHPGILELLLPDPARALACVKAISAALLRVRSLPIQESWRVRLTAVESASDWADFHGHVDSLRRQIEEIEAALDKVIQLAEVSPRTVQHWQRLRIDEWLGMVQRTLKADRLLTTRAQLLASRSRVNELGFEEIPRAMTDPAALKFEGIADLFRCVCLRSMAFAAIEEQPVLAEFRNTSPSAVREKFSQLDQELKALHRQELIEALMDRDVPQGVSVGLISARTELGLLEHVANLEKPRTSVRELLRRSGRALQALKPCFMMSPLSVAQLIERGKLTFDVVVFDEASQVRPEDAMSAMARGRQFVVVGDQMQLPPTSFGEKSHTDEPLDAEDDAETEETAAVESILELASAAYGHGRTLLWHYRSRDPALIAFSNREFYRNELLLFPCPSARNLSTGVKYVWVGGTYSARTNVEEAKVCARAAVEFMRKTPNRSLGIVALNRPQADLIDLELDKLIHDDPEASAYQAKWADGLEPLFVKNLENVQGDERDVILISTVFGNEESGRFFQRFGPINSVVGHRRLNVLFTRAKHQLVLFTSLPTEKIQSSENSHWGVRALKQYLDYARTGRLEQGTRSERSEDSPFEVAVRRALESGGFQCEPQVGVAGFFVDLAVRHPRYPDHFLAGIECDGAAYHSTRSARDRDRLRQYVLESFGWKIYRIWSTDWFGDPHGQLAKLIAYLEKLKSQPFEVAHHEYVDFVTKFGRPRKVADEFEAADEAKSPIVI